MQGRDLGYKIFMAVSIIRMVRRRATDWHSKPGSNLVVNLSTQADLISLPAHNLLATRTDPIRLAVPRKGEIKRFLVTLTVWK